MLQETREFNQLIVEIKSRIKASQLQAFRAVNKELINLYWDIGSLIVEKQVQNGWGSSVVEIVAKDLQSEFKGISGFSQANIWRMRNFYLAYKDNTILAQLVREIGWSHNIAILEKCKNDLEREYYIRMTRKFGWSRNVLMHNIDVQSYEKFLINQTNFDQVLTPELLDQAKLAVKDEYSFDFLELSEEHSEYQLEAGLVNNIKNFLSELGGYFCFIGNQYHLKIEEEDFYVDLLFYHRKLKCLVAIELKSGKFKPEYIGKMGFYLTALDHKVRLEGENKSIGMIICKDKNRTVVEYALQDAKKPMGVATYQSGKNMPQEIEGLLPSPEDIIKTLKLID